MADLFLFVGCGLLVFCFDYVLILFADCVVLFGLFLVWVLGFATFVDYFGDFLFVCDVLLAVLLAGGFGLV